MICIIFISCFFTERIKWTRENTIHPSIKMVRQYSTGRKIETGFGFDIFQFITHISVIYKSKFKER